MAEQKTVQLGLIRAKNQRGLHDRIEEFQFDFIMAESKRLHGKIGEVNVAKWKTL